MNLSEFIRHIVAVVVASAILVGLTTGFAESATWSERVGLGVFFMAWGALIVAMVHCHRLQTTR